jgi:hypothetical protein
MEKVKVRSFWLEAGDSKTGFDPYGLFGTVTLKPCGYLLLQPDFGPPVAYWLYRDRGKVIVKRDDGKIWKRAPKDPVDRYAWELLTDPIGQGLIKGFCPRCGKGLRAEEWDRHIQEHEELLRAWCGL